MKIKILGSGCVNCKKLYHNSLLAITELQRKAEVIKVTDFKEIAEYGVMRTPALVIDDSVVAQGQVLTKEQIIDIIEKQ